MKNRYAAPVPEVHYLPAIFRKIQSGELRIPAFQRGFVWKEKNILELMESIYLGYPIGSLLFWKSPIGQLKELSKDITCFPTVEDRSGDILYVLDGMQRVSTLYGAFHKIEGKNNKFCVAYDFIEDRFYFPTDEGALRDGSLPLDSLFIPRELLAFQSMALAKENGDAIIAKSIELQSIFQEYLIPTVTINERSVSDVVEIFTRVNSTGVKLDIVDFMRALTWSSQFDLTYEVEKLGNIAKALNFDIEGQTFVKLIALCAGFPTTSDAMYQMSNMDHSELHLAVEEAQRLVPLAISMLAQESFIIDSSLLGYEGQFLIWAAAIKTVNLNLSHDFSKIKNLVWQIGFGEVLRGKPDHFLERILKKIYSEQWNTFIADVQINENTLLTRRFLNGRALSSAIVSMLHHRLNYLKKNDLIDATFEFDGKLFPAFKIDRQFGETRSDKVFANLLGGSGLSMSEGTFNYCKDLYDYIEKVYGKKGLDDWMAFNFIDATNPPIILEDFFIKRSIEMKKYATKLLDEPNY